MFCFFVIIIIFLIAKVLKITDQYKMEGTIKTKGNLRWLNQC